MTQAILRENGRVIPRRSVRPLTIEEIHSPLEIEKRRQFDVAIKEKLGDCKSPLPPDTKLNHDTMPSIDDFMCEEDEDKDLISDLEETVGYAGKTVYEQSQQTL